MDAEQVRLLQERRTRRIAPEAIAEGILAGDRALLSRGITLIESSAPAHQHAAERILDLCLPHSGDSTRVGITGVPGVGKSTFIEALGCHLTRDRQEKLAVLAVDPSSPISGGSILGDKTRMSRLSVDPNAYIRPSPAAGAFGGVARKTRETIVLCEAAGFRNIFVETVGVGQSETAVSSMVDFFLLLMLAGAGDELQGMKRGILEMTDLIAINKADGDNRIASDAARRQYESALKLFPPRGGGWRPRAVTCSSRNGEGIAGIWKIIAEHQGQMKQSGWFERNRREQARRAMFSLIQDALEQRFFSTAAIRGELPALERDVVEGRVTSYRAARQLLEKFSPGEL